MKQMGERSAGNPHAAFDVEGAGNVARSKLIGLNRRASPRPYLCGGRPVMGVPTAIARRNQEISVSRWSSTDLVYGTVARISAEPSGRHAREQYRARAKW
jgi:hypothetical protein